MKRNLFLMPDNHISNLITKPTMLERARSNIASFRTRFKDFKKLNSQMESIISFRGEVRNYQEVFYKSLSTDTSSGKDELLSSPAFLNCDTIDVVVATENIRFRAQELFAEKKDLVPPIKKFEQYVSKICDPIINGGIILAVLKFGLSFIVTVPKSIDLTITAIALPLVLTAGYISLKTDKLIRSWGKTWELILEIKDADLSKIAERFHGWILYKNSNY